MNSSDEGGDNKRRASEKLMKKKKTQQRRTSAAGGVLVGVITTLVLVAMGIFIWTMVRFHRMKRTMRLERNIYVPEFTATATADTAPHSSYSSSSSSSLSSSTPTANSGKLRAIDLVPGTLVFTTLKPWGELTGEFWRELPIGTILSNMAVVKGMPSHVLIVIKGGASFDSILVAEMRGTAPNFNVETMGSFVTRTSAHYRLTVATLNTPIDQAVMDRLMRVTRQIKPEYSKRFAMWIIMRKIPPIISLSPNIEHARFINSLHMRRTFADQPGSPMRIHTKDMSLVPPSVITVMMSPQRGSYYDGDGDGDGDGDDASTEEEEDVLLPMIIEKPAYHSAAWCGIWTPSQTCSSYVYAIYEYVGFVLPFHVPIVHVEKREEEEGEEQEQHAEGDKSSQARGLAPCVDECVVYTIEDTNDDASSLTAAARTEETARAGCVLIHHPTVVMPLDYLKLNFQWRPGVRLSRVESIENVVEERR